MHCAPHGFNSNRAGDVHYALFENTYENDDELLSMFANGNNSNILFSYATIDYNRLLDRLRVNNNLPSFIDIRSRLLSDTAWQREGSYFLINFGLAGDKEFVGDLIKVVMGL